MISINRERLARIFVELCEIDSPSGRERQVCSYLTTLFERMGADLILEDDSAAATGSDCGNLLVRFFGSGPGEPVFFNCHMDTVQPGVGIKVRRRDDIFSSAGETVLGGDDKSGIAVLIEAITAIKEQDASHAPVEFLFTTCEEVGLRGAKAFDPAMLHARMGYALDSAGVARLVIGAPAANRFRVTVTGAAAHAGLHPEKGVNAIQVAARAVAGLRLGRLDSDSTANVGLVHGGSATNIVPEIAVVEGEVRSHQAEKLRGYTEEVKAAFEESARTTRELSGREDGLPLARFEIFQDYPVMRLSREEKVVARMARAAAALGQGMEYLVAGGGSDANIFNGRGLATAILATGMTNVHSTDETIALGDMVTTAELVASLLVGG